MGDDIEGVDEDRRNEMSQIVLMYSSESWVVTEAMLKILEGFHHQEDRWIAGMTAKCMAYGTWEYPPVVEALEEAGLYPIQEYIWRLKATITAQVAGHPIYEIFTEADWRPWKIRMMRWWDKDMVQ